MALLVSRLFQFAEKGVFRQLTQSNLISKNLALETANESATVSHWSMNQTRTYYGTRKGRETFTRPNETKRIKKLGWKARLSTPAGRLLLMRRILRGKYVLCHA